MVTVLVVDDDPAISRLLKLILSTEEIEVESAGSGEAALELLLEEHARPDVILLDLAMPGIDGREVFRSARLAGVTCPIVVCSAHGAREASRELGAQGAIEKPFSPETVVASIDALTNGTH